MRYRNFCAIALMQAPLLCFAAPASDARLGTSPDMAPLDMDLNLIANAIRAAKGARLSGDVKFDPALVLKGEHSLQLNAPTAFPPKTGTLNLASLGGQTPADGGQSSNGRALPSPLTSPPFPDSDWLGFPLIGAPYSGSPEFPLEKALTGNRWLSKDYELYGWINPSFNYSTSHNSNQPLSYDLVPNKMELDQAIIVGEKWPDSTQTTHDGWGFRTLNLYGTNYRYTIMDGVFSNQLLKYNNLYGFDPVEFYGIYYTPKVAQGMIVRVGRYISPPDIEAQLTPDNYMYSHSLMFSVDPYTFMGVNAMIRYSKTFSLMLQVDGGNDMAVWSPAASPNVGIMGRWVSANGNDGLWGGINSLGAGKVKDYHDDLQQIVFTEGHRFNTKYHMMTEAYYMWEYGAPLGGTQIDGPSFPFASGGGPGPIIPGKSEAEGLVNYFEILQGKWDFMTIRTDFLNDPEGYRTGYKSLFFSESVGWDHFFTPMLSLRPEIRWEHAFNAAAYDNGTRKTQFEIASDLVLRF